MSHRPLIYIHVFVNKLFRPPLRCRGTSQACNFLASRLVAPQFADPAHFPKHCGHYTLGHCQCITSLIADIEPYSLETLSRSTGSQ